MTDQELLKEKAGRIAADFIEDGMIIGLGTGSTVKYFFEALSEKISTGGLKNIYGIPSSVATEQQARKSGIPLASFADFQKLDITVDGADEVDPGFNLIKGGGGALLREKVLAQASTRYIIIIDQSKYSPKLGSKWPVPVEVLPYAEPLEYVFLKRLGARVELRRTENGDIYLTDQNNHILDCNFGPIDNPAELAQALDNRAGIQGHGLFLDFTTDLVIAADDGIKHMQKSR